MDLWLGIFLGAGLMLLICVKAVAGATVFCAKLLMQWVMDGM